ncbi:MAG TPA: diguanylate cyclase [Candidatus Treponema faecavium]|nr:diguanylate cyclase [Candidatus Treponema faecavium]
MNRVLLVEDDPGLVSLLSLELTHAGYGVTAVTDGMSALQTAFVEPWDLILMDIMLPELTGLQVLQELRKTLMTPVILLTAKNTEEDIIQGLEAGADDYLTKPFSMGELLARIKTAIRKDEQQKKWRELSFKDTLTGLLNRRGFSETVKLVLQANRHTHHALALMMIDVDNFKNYNDTYGHPQGDVILKTVAEQLTAAAKHKNAILSRFGGEEFIALLSDCTLQSAQETAETLRAAVESLALASGEGALLPIVTVSIGLAVSAPQEESEFNTFIGAADKALYQSKANGKNQVTTAQ